MKCKKANFRGIKLLGVLLIFSNLSFSEEVISSNITGTQLLNLAGKQRMLSQRIAKDYIYRGKEIATIKASRQLKASLDSFSMAHKKLISSVKNEEIKSLLEFVELSSSELKEITSKEFNLDNAQLILDLSESMLEGSQSIFELLQSSLKIQKSIAIERSTRQRMLSQRIAKYYISYQSGIKDENTASMMKQAVEEFSENLEILIKNPANTAQITNKLLKIKKLWRIVYKFYINIENGELPLIVFSTTDEITAKMDEVTKLYLMNHK